MTTRKHLGDILVEAGIITVKTLERALERQKGEKLRLGMVLEEMGVITEEELVESLAKQFDFQIVKHLAAFGFPPEFLDMIPEDVAVSRLVFPLKLQDSRLAVAITDPFDWDTIDYIAKRTRLQILPVLTTRHEILSAIKKHYLKESAEDDGRRKVLIVEEKLAIATVLEVALSKEGFHVLLANDGLDAFKLALVERPELIICDSMLPRMDGYGLQRALKNNAETAHIPMILLTSKASCEDEQKALAAGFLDFIPKPVQPVRVVSRVKRAFEIMKNQKK